MKRIKKNHYVMEPMDGAAAAFCLRFQWGDEITPDDPRRFLPLGTLSLFIIAAIKCIERKHKDIELTCEWPTDSLGRASWIDDYKPVDRQLFKIVERDGKTGIWLNRICFPGNKEDYTHRALYTEIAARCPVEVWEGLTGRGAHRKIVLAGMPKPKKQYGKVKVSRADARQVISWLEHAKNLFGSVEQDRVNAVLKKMKEQLKGSDK